MPVRWGVHQIPQINLDLNLSRCRVALRPAVLSAARIWPSVSRCLEISFGLRGPSPQAFTPFRGGLGSLPGAWGAPNKGNAEGAEGIFDKLRARVGYGPAPGPTLKKGLVPYMPVRWGVHQIPQINLDLNLSRCRVALRPAVLSAARIWPSVSRYLEFSFGLRGPSPQAFTSFGRVGFSCPAPEAPLIKGNAEGAVGYFWQTPGACGLRPCARSHPKKGLVPYMPVRWGVHQIPQINLDLNLSRCRVALRPAVLSAARIWPSVSRCLEISFGLRGPSPQAFTPFQGGVGFIARCLRLP